MFSAYVIWITGIVLSVWNILIWVPMTDRQVRKYKMNPLIKIKKRALIFFTVTSIWVNVISIWFYAFRLSEKTQPTNIFYAWAISIFIFNTITALIFKIIDRDE